MQKSSVQISGARGPAAELLPVEWDWRLLDRRPQPISFTVFPRQVLALALRAAQICFQMLIMVIYKDRRK